MTRLLGLVTWDARHDLCRVISGRDGRPEPRPLRCHRDGRVCTYWCTHHRLEAAGGARNVLCADTRAVLGQLDDESADLDLVRGLSSASDLDDHRAALAAQKERNPHG